MSFETIRHNMLNRRSVKPEAMNGKIIPEAEVKALLELANWAPTHGHTEPWRFVVFTGDSLKTYSAFHADLYKRAMEAEGKDPVKYQKLLHRTEKVSHVIAIGMKRGNNPKIPESEEHAATAIAANNIWLGATAKGIACYWGSGGMTYDPQMRKFLGWGDIDLVLGFLHLGYSDEPPRPGKRLTGIEDKVDWV